MIRCGLNTWCCSANNHTNCCDTNLTTSLAPFPYTTIYAASVSPTNTITIINPTFSAHVLSMVPSSSASRTGSAMKSQPAPTSTSTLSSTFRSESTRRGLSTGAEAGLGIAVVASVLLLVALIYTLCRARKRKDHRFELGGDGRHEMMGNSDGLRCGR